MPPVSMLRILGSRCGREWGSALIDTRRTQSADTVISVPVDRARTVQDDT
jgi:hypothetical protein